MMNRLKTFSVAVPGIIGSAAIFLLMTGCGAAISPELRAQVDPAVAFKAVFQDPDAYKGKVVLWGGEIIQVRNAKDGTWIELLQRPLGGDDRPIRDSASEGRFLVRHSGFLDPAVYAPGREMTVAGAVEGRRRQPLGEIEYSYPVVSDKQRVIWGPRQEPTFHFGLGIIKAF